MTHDDRQPAPRPARKLSTWRFRQDLLDRLRQLAAKSRPRVSVTSLMKHALEEYPEQHEPRQGSKRRQAGRGPCRA